MNRKFAKMLISSKSVGTITELLGKSSDVFCSGLFLSARWFVVSQLSYEGIQVIVLPDRDSAEYCAVDLYNLIEGDCVFFMPDSGKTLEKSNYKASLGVQRTSAIGKIMEYGGGPLVIVTYPSALEEAVPVPEEIRKAVMRLSVGDEISHDALAGTLVENGFERVDFVAEPGQFAIRGAVADIFSYSYNDPFRISFFGDEIESINIFDCNSQLSKEKVKVAEISPDIVVSDAMQACACITDILPPDTLVWLDSSDMYKDKDFFARLGQFRRVWLEVPLSMQDVEPVKFNIRNPSSTRISSCLRKTYVSVLKKGIRSESMVRSSPSLKGHVPYFPQMPVSCRSSCPDAIYTTDSLTVTTRSAVTVTMRFSTVSTG